MNTATTPYFSIHNVKEVTFNVTKENGKIFIAGKKFDKYPEQIDVGGKFFIFNKELSSLSADVFGLNALKPIEYVAIYKPQE